MLDGTRTRSLAKTISGSFKTDWTATRPSSTVSSPVTTSDSSSWRRIDSAFQKWCSRRVNSTSRVLWNKTPSLGPDWRSEIACCCHDAEPSCRPHRHFPPSRRCSGRKSTAADVRHPSGFRPFPISPSPTSRSMSPETLACVPSSIGAYRVTGLGNRKRPAFAMISRSCRLRRFPGNRSRNTGGSAWLDECGSDERQRPRPKARSLLFVGIQAAEAAGIT